MKCQKCNKPATFHITEILDDSPVDLHFCEKHAQEYLRQNAGPQGAADDDSSLSGFNPKGKNDSPLQKTAQELMEADFQSCPYCGMGFQEFRKTGRLGCPNDYTCFGELLDPLLFSIHGDTEHVGKRPAKYASTDQRTLLVRLRHELDDAISIEDYERASRLRDRIKALESRTA